MFSRTFCTKALLWNILVCWLYTTAYSELTSEKKETSSKITSNLKEIKRNLQEKNVVEAFSPADTNTKGERTREKRDNVPVLIQAEHQHQSSTSSPTNIAAITTPTSSSKITVTENIPTEEQVPACKFPGYQHGSSSLTTAAVASEEASSIQYNISFIVNKLTFEEVKSNPAKPASEIAAKLTGLFMNSNIKATFIKCMVNIFREVMNDSTRVAVNCSFKSESETQGIDKEHVYDVLKEEIQNSSSLGSYELEKNIYVNGYTEFTTAIVPEEERNPIQYYVAFNVRKPNFEEIQSNATEQARVITAELTDLFLSSSINATFLNCIFHSFREVVDDSTRVTANCSFKNQSDIEGVMRERVYAVVVKKTNDMSTLGTYELGQHSLYVSDQLELLPTIVPEEERNPIQYYVAFNVRKPNFVEIQSNTTEQARVMTAELTYLFLSSSINATFLNCIFHSFREVVDDSTRVTANCSFKNETDIEGVMRERVYKVVVMKTNDMSKLGTYELEQHSLYVSDQMELLPTIVPEEERNPIQYYVAFNVRKPNFEEIQSNATEQARVITAELTDLFLSSSINATFLNCIFHSFRKVIDDSTRVTANCSFKNETDIEGVMRERVYEVVVKKTNDMSTLGTYKLEQNSLHVSEQMELLPTIVPEEERNPIQYYVAFNVRKPNFVEIQSNTTEQARVITAELTYLFLSSSINATFLNCIFHSFREVVDDSTRVTANCSFKNETDIEGVMRERVYKVVVTKTNDMSKLGTYELEQHSLYVSDQMELLPTIVPEEERNPIQYYVAFNVRKPNFEEIQSNATEQARVITAELTDLFLSSSINATFLNCIFHSFRKVIDDSTRVTANCSFKNETDIEGVMRERVYEVVVKKTNDMSTLGTYKLEQNSLHVSEQMELLPTIVPEEERNPIQYYVAFNVRKPNFAEIQSNTTEQARVITAELTYLFLSSSINATFLNCIFHSFREEVHDSTRVTANCSFKNETDIEGVLRERVYKVVVTKTNDMSKLGTYELEQHSLYVSDQMELLPTIVPEEERNPIQYYVAFNVRKPNFEEIQSNATEQARVITAELTDLLLSSSINATFLNCIFHSFRKVIDDSTRVTANCSFKNETDIEGVMRERVYEVVVKKTNDMSTLGTYELEQNSLHVSEQMELLPTIVPEEERNPIQYYVAFNVRKPKYVEIQSNTTEQARVITAELTYLFLSSSINATFLNCIFHSFREVVDDSTRVTANCSFKNETDIEGVMRERVYKVVVTKTNDMSKLGTYELEQHSLYVSDQMELLPTIVPEEERNPIQYYVAFNVRKPNFEEIQSNATEQARVITAELTDLFLSSSINATFLNCIFHSFRKVIDDSTRVTANCSFKNETDIEGVMRERVYEVVVKKTNDMSTLGTYELEQNSLHVSEQMELLPTIVPEEERNPIQYYVAFNVRKPNFEEIQSNATEQARVITAELTDLFLSSSINATFLNCIFHSFRKVIDDSTRVTANCSFKNETDIEGVMRERVYEVVVKKTNDMSTLGTYELEQNSLHVSEQMELLPTIVPEEERNPIQYYVAFNVRKPNFAEIQSNTTEQARVITAELTYLFLSSSINATFLNCIFHSFREVVHDSTRVTANCSFKNETDIEGVLRERVYKVVVTKTNDMSTLGTYELEQHSLYVSDQMELLPTIVPEEDRNPIQYYVAFNVRKPNFEEMQSNATEQARVITAELTDLFLSSSINATFLNCIFQSFRKVIDDSTRVTANCSFKNETDIEGVMRERVYEVVVKKTNDMSTLGTYELEQNSLHVSEQMELLPTIVPEEERNPIQYYVAFNVRKPNFAEIQSNTTEQARVITAELTYLFLSSSINATFLNCIFHSFREVVHDSTRVTANCSFKNETDIEGVLRERVYKVVVTKTNDMSTLGTYELEQHSLYVSDQMELLPTIVPEEERNPIQYYVAFNVRKPNFEEMQSNATEQARVITAELTDLFLSSSINATFLNCIFQSFRKVIDDSTRVTANCSFKNETDIEGVMRERVYEVVVKKTNDMSTLGTYELEQNSLHVSEQMELLPTIVPEDERNPTQFYVAFNVRKPNFEEIQSNATEQARVITAELTDLFLSSSINATFLNCIFQSFRKVIDDSTRVTANCSFKNETDIEGVMRERVYEVVVKKTNDMSTLGTYELEQNSLHVSEQMELLPTIVPEDERNPTQFYVAFNVRKPNFEEIQSNATEQARVITAELTDLFLSSSINATFLNCIFHSFRKVIDDSTRVIANCSFKNETDIEGVMRERVYEVVVKKTNDMSTLGTYELEQNSLHVSEQMELLPTIVPEEERNPIQYYVAFNIKKPNFEEIQANATEQARVITAEITDLFLSSSINATFLNCIFYSFRKVIDDSTRVTANCSFKNETDIEGVMRARVYEVVVKKTNDMSTLGTYEMEQNSLHVSDQLELLPTIVPEEVRNPIQYYVAFNVRKPNFEEIQSNTTEQARVITAELTDLFLNSSINATFLNCIFHSFREAIDDSTRVTANCSFKNVTDIEGVMRERVYEVFVKKTNDISTLGTYELEQHSLHVSDQLELLPTIVPKEETSPITYYLSFIVNKPNFEEIQSNLTEQARVITAELTDLFLNSSINATFMNCVVHSFREVIENNTRVTANCSFNNETDVEGITREHVYEVVEKKISEMSALGPYDVEENTLYVSDNLQFPTTIVPPQEMITIHYNLSFIVKNPKFDEIKSKADVIAAELTDLFLNSSINATFLKCLVYSFRVLLDESTRVTANCSFKNKSDIDGANREYLYDMFKKKTDNISRLGQYELEKHSLYVNGYMEKPEQITTVPVKHIYPIYYNVTFVVNKLAPEEIKSNTTEQASMISAELTDLFKNSKINTTFIECTVESFRTVLDDSTRVTANCSFKNESLNAGINRERVYDVFKEETNNMSTLGSYDLENYSLYVNGYREIPPHLIPGQSPVEFNVTFSIRDLKFMEALHDNTSQLHKSASTVVTQQLNTIFRNSKLKKNFVDCKMISLRVISQKTKIYAICTFKNSANIQIDRVTVYQQFSKNTENLSALGPYQLDHNSLYVNGYNESTPPTASTGPASGFNVTFIITSLTFTSALHDQSSALHKSAVQSFIHQFNYVFQNSDLKKQFTGCEVISLNLSRNKWCSVNAMCFFSSTSAKKVDRVVVYHQFSNNTNNIRRFGPYFLDENSLYVDDYHESTDTNEEPNQSRSHPGFNVTFTITNLPYMEALHNQASLLYKSASLTITKQLTDLFEKSQINTTFIACSTMSLSATSGHNTKVYADCSFNETSGEGNVDRVTVYQQFRYKTKNLTVLGPYSLDNNSLFVNDYHESAYPTNEPPIIAGTQHPSLSQPPLCFNMSFIAMRLAYSSLLLDPTSQVYQSASSNCIQQLNSMFRNSSISAAFWKCTNVSFSNANEGLVKVLATCLFKDDVLKVDNVIVDQVFREATNNTFNTFYGFLTDNLQVTGCKEPEAPTTVARPSQQVPTVELERQGDLTFQVNFTIVNVNFTDNLFNSSSSDYTNLTKSITKEMSELFGENSLKKSHKFCRVTELSPGPSSPETGSLRSVNVFTICFFDPVKETESITENRLRSDFQNGTDNLSWLGKYRLSPESFSVAAASPVTTDRIELPYWAIIIIVLGILLALLLLMILGCLIALCVKKKFHGFYNLLQNPFGIYYSHLDGK